MNRFGHGGRQKRLIIGQVRVKVENLSAARPLESIVRKVSCDTTIPVGRGERLSEKKKRKKKKGDARDKKNRFPARNQTIHRVSIPRTLWRNEQQDPVDRQKIVARFCFISDDDLTRFRNLFRISSFFFRSFFFNFFFSFFLFLSFFFFLLHYAFRRGS